MTTYSNESSQEARFQDLEYAAYNLSRRKSQFAALLCFNQLASVCTFTLLRLKQPSISKMLKRVSDRLKSNLVRCNFEGLGTEIVEPSFLLPRELKAFSCSPGFLHFLSVSYTSSCNTVRDGGYRCWIGTQMLRIDHDRTCRERLESWNQTYRRQKRIRPTGVGKTFKIGRAHV